MPLARPAFATPAEGFAATFDERTCDPEPKPGVVAFAAFVTRHQGGIGGRITGPCGVKSGHASGRAWDWMISADDPDERARADELIDWLLANDAELFRRAGLRYIIWDRRVWSTLSKSWRPYDAYDAAGRCTVFDKYGQPACRHPHRDHVHFSFGVDGAAGRTSFFRWLGLPEQPVQPPGAPAAPWWTLLGAAVGFAGAMAFSRRSANR